MKEKEFKELKKKHDPQKIIYNHTRGEITLLPKQITELIKIRDKKEFKRRTKCTSN